MKVLDGKNKLEYSQIVSFIRELEDDYILISYEHDGNEVELVEVKQNLLNALFDRKSLNNIPDETVISVFNGNIMIETTKKELHFWGTSARLERLKPLLGIESNKEEIVDEVKQKIIAIGLFAGDDIIEIESLVVTQKDTKKAVEFINDKISMYYVNDIQDDIRININYDESAEIRLSEWLTIKELFERGIAK